MNNVPPRWYCVDANGLATLCADEANARDEAAKNDTLWPNNAPHTAVMLAPAASAVPDGYVSITEYPPPRNETVVYWCHQNGGPGFPAVADEWRDEHHAAGAVAWHPQASSSPLQPAGARVSEGWHEFLKWLGGNATVSRGRVYFDDASFRPRLAAMLAAAPKADQPEPHSSIIGECVEIGDDETGQPRIVIQTTRDAILNCASPMLFERVRVTQEAGDAGGGA